MNKMTADKHSLIREIMQAYVRCTVTRVMEVCALRGYEVNKSFHS